MDEHQNSADDTGFFHPDNFPPELIHRILLSDVDRWSYITFKEPTSTSNNFPRSLEEEIKERIPQSFEDFSAAHSKHSLSTSDESGTPTTRHTSVVLRRAYLSEIHRRWIEDRSDSMVRDICLELYRNLRSLVPQRTDLHKYLNDNDVSEERWNLGKGTSSTSTLLVSMDPIIRAGEALAQLEAPDQVDATQEWLRLSSSLPQQSSWFVVLSISYLLEKTASCREDVRNVHLRRHVVPRLLVHGAEMGLQWERYYFCRRVAEETSNTHSFAEVMASPTSIPNTRSWIRRWCNSLPPNNDDGSDTLLRLLLQRGIVQSIIFATVQTPYPEILEHDAVAFAVVRRSANISVTGSALILHCGIISGIVDPSSLDLAEMERALSFAEDERIALRSAMLAGASRGEGDGRLLTDTLQKSILSLAKALVLAGGDSVHGAPELSSDQQSRLFGRSVAVLNGHDPVFKIMDARVRIYLESVVVWKWEVEGTSLTTTTPPRMQAGRVVTNPNTDLDPVRHAFMDHAKAYARRSGFSVFAEELAVAGWTLRKIGHHAWRVFGAALLGPLCAAAQTTELGDT